MLFFGVGGFFHVVRGKFTEDVSETAVDPVFTDYNDDGTHMII
jgi:hypothetical protein